MTPADEPDERDLPSTTPELRSQRLGFALRGLAAELVDERRKVAQLRHQVADLQAQLEALTGRHSEPPRPDLGRGFIHPG